MTDALLESGAVERGVAKLFRGKVTPFGSSGLRFTQSAALSAIAIVGLKSLVEHIRLLTLGKEGGCALRQVMITAPCSLHCTLGLTLHLGLPHRLKLRGLDKTVACRPVTGACRNPVGLSAFVCCTGLQQLQLDVCYLRPKLLQLVGGVDAEPVAQLLDDVVAAAAERSTDPTLLDAAAIEAALAAANTKQSAQA